METRIEEQAKAQVQEHADWIEKFARFGYVARGLVYTLVGSLALQAAVGPGGRVTDSEGALQSLVYQPFGRVLLGIIGAGLMGYAFWRIIEGVMDPEKKGSDVKGIAQRISYIAISLAYGGLALTAFQLMVGMGGSGGDSTRLWVARALAQPFGQWLVGIGGSIVVGVGLYQLYQAWTAKFKQQLDLGRLSASGLEWVERVGRLGFAARGVTFGIMGVFVVIAAIQSQPSEARDLGGALQALAQQPYGPWLLALVAVGLVAYGIYSVVAAAYHRIKV